MLVSMEAEKQKNVKWTGHDGFTRSVTYVQSRTPVIDEKGLRKALGAKTFDKFTTKKLDRKAMEQAMDTGEVDPVVVSKYVTERLSKPFIKFTVTDQEQT